MGILACVLLAYVLSYALGSWLDDRLPQLAPPVPTVDGSVLNGSRYYGLTDGGTADTILPADQTTLLAFYRYLDEGGSSAYASWRSARRALGQTTSAFRLRALTVADATNAGRYLALLLLIVTGLLIGGRAFRETSLLTPVLYLLIMAGTVWLYGSLSAPLYFGTVVGALVLYFGGLRAFLPIYNVEWNRAMRPGLTLCVFLLATMAWRGPELVDYWFWTSPLFRFGLVLTLLLTVFFHLNIINGVLTNAKMTGPTRFFALGMPLGFTLATLGLFLEFYGPAAGTALQQINYELVALPPATVVGFDPDAPFYLAIGGVFLLALAGIGYFVQKIAR